MRFYLLGSEEMAKLLINNGANVNIKDDSGISPLDIASARNFLHEFERKIKHFI